MARTSKTIKDAFLSQLGEKKERKDKLKNESDLGKVAYLMSLLSEKQRAACQDTHPMVSIRTPRRAGKTFMAMVKAISTALSAPQRQVMIIGLSFPSVKRLYWGELQKLNDKYDLGMSFNKTEASVKFRNESAIILTGAKDDGEREKIRGLGSDLYLAIVEECKSFAPHRLEELVHTILEPALGDNQGQLMLVGTPGADLMGPFYRATNPDAQPFVADDGFPILFCKPYGKEIPGTMDYVWSFHTWTLEDNKFMPHLWSRALMRKRQNGWGDDHPEWRREYLGEWVRSDEILVWRVYERHQFKGELPKEEMFYVIGIDIGGEPDPTAVVLLGYTLTSRYLYELMSVRLPNPTVAQIARLVEEAIEITEARGGSLGYLAVADPGGPAKPIIRSLQLEYGLNVRAAQKQKKEEAIKAINLDLDEGLIRFNGESDLYDEMRKNKWHEAGLKRGLRVEDKRTPNDLSDAFVYAWRECNHRLGRAVGKENALSEYELSIQAELERAEAYWRKLNAKHDEIISADDWWLKSN